MVPNRVTVWKNGKPTAERVYRPGPILTFISDTRVEGYYGSSPRYGNGFNVSRSEYGFKVGGCNDQYYFSDIGKELVFDSYVPPENEKYIRRAPVQTGEQTVKKMFEREYA
jgi:hypothetical protein